MEASAEDKLERMRSHFHDANGHGMPLDDACFMRYLRAEKGHLDRAIAKLQATLRWRDEFGLDGFSSWADVISHENATGKVYVRGYDKEGRVVMYMKPRLDNTTDHDGQLKHVVYQMERAIACMRERGQQEKLCLVIDYNGYSLRHAPPMRTSMAVLSILQDQYPERLGRAYMCSPPWIFQAFWTLIYPFIDPVTKQKIVFCNSPYAELRDSVPSEMLESWASGHDDRPFDSTTYLSASFSDDFYSILEKGWGKGEAIPLPLPLTPDGVIAAAESKEEGGAIV